MNKKELLKDLFKVIFGIVLFFSSIFIIIYSLSGV